MTQTRKAFIKKACLSGACLCGFASLVQAIDSEGALISKEKPDPNKTLMHDWISTLLHSIEQQKDEIACRKIMKVCAGSHYSHLQMDDLLKPYEGDLESFNLFIEQKCNICSRAGVCRGMNTDAAFKLIIRQLIKSRYKIKL
jgi:hypothetical protein